MKYLIIYLVLGLIATFPAFLTIWPERKTWRASNYIFGLFCLIIWPVAAYIGLKHMIKNWNK